MDFLWFYFLQWTNNVINLFLQGSLATERSSLTENNNEITDTMRIEMEYDADRAWYGSIHLGIMYSIIIVEIIYLFSKITRINPLLHKYLSRI